MSDYSKAVGIIQNTFEGLQRSGIISGKATFSEDAIVLGTRSQLDSLGFVTFISDLEERLSSQEGRDVYLVLNDISDFNMNNPSLSVRALASYLVNLLQAGRK